MSEPRVAILGAGPAGCAAALTLGRSGIRPVVLERGLPGKDKPCGDAYLPDAIALLTSLGLDLTEIDGSRARSFSAIDLWDARRPIWTVPLDGQTGVIAPRAIVDQALRDAAAQCSDLRYGVLVTGITWSEPGWWVQTPAQDQIGEPGPFDAVILAMGAANALARSFGIAGDPITGASMTAYLTVADLREPLFQFSPLGLDGYGWIFPLANGEVNIGVCAASQPPRDFRQRTLTYLDMWCPGQSPHLRAGAGPLWSGRGRTWHDPRGLISCGDAAGLVDPLTGEGIAPAFESGMAGAAALLGWLANRETTDLARYSRLIRETFEHRYGQTPARSIWRHLNQATAA